MRQVDDIYARSKGAFFSVDNFYGTQHVFGKLIKILKYLVREIDLPGWGHLKMYLTNHQEQQ